MGFLHEDIEWIFSLAAAILHLGNVAFEPTDAGEGSAIAQSTYLLTYLPTYSLTYLGEGSAIDQSTEAALSLAAHYLHVEASTLRAALTTRTVVIRGEAQHMRNRTSDAAEAVEALCKAIYSSLFDDLVARINGAVGGERGVSIGVLDIFGFEIFETNSFEQLCINFANERLQQRFNAHTFTQELDVYEAEGVAFEPIPFLDNAPVLTLLASKPRGLFNLLDEEVIIPKGSDLKWLAKCACTLYPVPCTSRERPQVARKVSRGPRSPCCSHPHAHVHVNAHARMHMHMRTCTCTCRCAEAHAAHAAFGAPKVTQRASTFHVAHYAGVVTYEVASMVEKNASYLLTHLLTY